MASGSISNSLRQWLRGQQPSCSSSQGLLDGWSENADARTLSSMSPAPVLEGTCDGDSASIAFTTPGRLRPRRRTKHDSALTAGERLSQLLKSQAVAGQGDRQKDGYKTNRYKDNRYDDNRLHDSTLQGHVHGRPPAYSTPRCIDGASGPKSESGTSDPGKSCSGALEPIATRHRIGRRKNPESLGSNTPQPDSSLVRHRSPSRSPAVRESELRGGPRKFKETEFSERTESLMKRASTEVERVHLHHMSASADGLCPSLQGPSMQSSSIHGHVWDTSPPGSSEGAAIRDRPSLTMEQKLRLLEKYRADMSYKLAVSDSVTVAVEYFSAKEKAGTLGEGETLAEEDALLEPDGTLIGTHLLSEHCRIKVLINVILERCIGGGPTTYLIDTLSTWCGSNPYKIHILIKKFQSIVKHADAFSDACIHNICYLYTQLIVNETIPLLLLHYTGVDRDGETNARLLTRLMLINLVEAWGFRLTKAKFAQDPKLVEIMATPSYIALLKDLGFLFLVPSNEQESCHLGKHHLSNNHLGNNHGVVQGVLQGGGNHSLVTGADECEPASRTPVCERSAYLTTFPSACEYRLPSHHAGHGLSLSAMHRESVGHHKHPPTGNPLAGNPPTGNPLAGNPLAGNPLAGHTKMGHLHEDGLVSKSADTLASGCSRVYYDAERGNICKVVCRPVRVEPIDESDSSDSVSNPSIELTESAHSSSISLTLGEPYLTDLSSDDEEHPKCTRRRLCRVVCVTSP